MAEHDRTVAAIAAGEAALPPLQSQAASLSQTIAAGIADRDRLTASLEALDGQAKTARESLATLQTAIVSTQAALLPLQHQKASLAQAITDDTATRERLEEAVAAASAEAGKARDDATRARTAATEAEKTRDAVLADLQRKADALGRQVMDTGQRLDAARAALTDTTAALEARRAALRQGENPPAATKTPDPAATSPSP